MNEFIVWDKTEIGKKPRLIEFDSFSIKENWIYLELNDIQVLHAHIDDVEICYYIGKTDIEGEKIYADSSIVEFNFDGQRRRAYLAYDDIQLMLDFVFLKDVFRCPYVEIHRRIYNVKIIGTLQQDKHLLEER